ncbi:MAG: DUF2267 domain-containing protein [Pseudomonadota bacterium]
MMPRPQAFQTAQQDFDQLLADIAEALDLSSRHQAYTVLESVLHAKRRRLDAPQIITYAGSLPPLLAALFVQGWSVDAPTSSGPVTDAEIEALRAAHNFAPPGAYVTVMALIEKADG